MQRTDIAIRAYVCMAETAMPDERKQKSKKKRARTLDEPSEWTLIWDTETTTDPSQKLRFGTYQVRENEALFESGIFYDPHTLDATDQKTIKRYAQVHDLKLLSAKDFVDEVFYYFGYECRASIVGMNLPFDISRLAIGHAPARTKKYNKIMQGGFTCKLSDNPQHPRVQIKHLSSRNAFIQFGGIAEQRTTRGNRKKENEEPVRRGFFVDIKTLAAALTSTGHSLESLPKALGIEIRKHQMEEHGKTLTPEYIAYAVQDTQVTWECYQKLKSQYDLHGLQKTGAHKIQSEASLGKAYLKEMNIKSWKQLQSDFPPEMIGQIMSTYFGGRSEVHIRRQIVQVLYCDFLSMYPTVCTLMSLWQFVIAQGMTWKDTTGETAQFLEQITIAELQQPETWRKLCTIVQVLPNDEIYPVRAKYSYDSQYTIGSNHLISEKPLWFTLADCISAKLLSGRSPKIIKAISFAPMDVQTDLAPVNIAGDETYRVNPYEGDFFKRVIDLRNTTKKAQKEAAEPEKSVLNDKQKALKILANATSYGIFVELNVEEDKQAQDMLCHSASGAPIPIRQNKYEAQGSFFHPLLGTLITGAARLMLALTEHMAIANGLDWALCDTDSMALARPDDMPEGEFIEKVQQVREWFTPLNPYAEKEPLLKLESYNYGKSGTLQPLYCLGISSKRYALFNLENGKISLRKVSSHGLGHFLPPYQRDDVLKLEDALAWHQDMWLEIIKAELNGNGTRPDYGSLKNFDTPAVSRYGATTPALEKWFDKFNAEKSYIDRVRPFNFMLAFHPKKHLKELKPVAPYNKDHTKALAQCFDRATGEKISKRQLKTYEEALAQYHLHPESKFLNGDFLDKGHTERRHIVVKTIRYIGKEANKLEEQFYLGADPEAQIEYGISPEDKHHMLQVVLQAVATHGASALAEISQLTAKHVQKISAGKSKPSDKTLAKLHVAAQYLETENNHTQAILAKINALIAEKIITCRSLAAKLDMDTSNLAKMLTGKRHPNKKLIICLHDYIAG